MSAGTSLAVALAAATGAGMAVQAAVMGTLGSRVGTIEALGFSMIVAGLSGAVVLLAARQSFRGVSASLHQPVWLWTGGMFSVLIVLGITFATPRIGVTALVALTIAGQLAASLAIDRFGWFGFERIPLSWPRVLGIVLLAGGAALTLRK